MQKNATAHDSPVQFCGSLITKLLFSLTYRMGQDSPDAPSVLTAFSINATDSFLSLSILLILEVALTLIF